MQTFIVLGPDRVGKSTLIRNTETALTAAGYDTVTLHFREVRPHHNSPIDQFYEEIDSRILQNRPDVCLIDRFVPDTLFYETHPANFPEIPVTLANSVESLLLQSMGPHKDLHVIHMAMDWSEEIAQRHRLEIIQQYPDCSEYWIGINLEKRKHEHHAYNAFVWNYFNGRKSLFPVESYKRIRRFDISPSLSVFDIFSSINPADTELKA